MSLLPIEAHNEYGVCFHIKVVSQGSTNALSFPCSGNPLSSGRWSTDGCVRNDNLSNSTHTVCQCTHLTNFAILLSARPLALSRAVALSLEIIGYIGVSLSVIAMVATIITLVFLR